LPEITLHPDAMCDRVGVTDRSTSRRSHVVERNRINVESADRDLQGLRAYHVHPDGLASDAFTSKYKTEFYVADLADGRKCFGIQMDTESNLEPNADASTMWCGTVYVSNDVKDVWNKVYGWFTVDLAGDPREATRDDFLPHRATSKGKSRPAKEPFIDETIPFRQITNCRSVALGTSGSDVQVWPALRLPSGSLSKGSGKEPWTLIQFGDVSSISKVQSRLS
jgi:hypothetical protein